MFGGEAREARLSWCGHVQRRDRRMLRMALPGRRSRATPETGEDVKEAGVDISSDQATRSAFVESQKCSAGSDLKSSCLQPHSCCVLSHIHDEAPPSLSGAPIRWAETQRQERSEQQATPHSRMFLESESASAGATSRVHHGHAVRAVSLGTRRVSSRARLRCSCSC